MRACALVLAGLVLVAGHAGDAVAGAATEVRLNGVLVNGLAGQTLEDVDVRFDAEGNVWIDAPRYRVDAVEPAQAGAKVPTERFWLVSQDAESHGHAVDVEVNGALIRTIRSGDPAVILDLAPFLRPGPNEVVLRAAAAPGATGGPLSVHVGEGSNRGGTIDLVNPDASLVRRAGRSDRDSAQRAQLVVR